MDLKQAACLTGDILELVLVWGVSDWVKGTKGDCLDWLRGAYQPSCKDFSGYWIWDDFCLTVFKNTLSNMLQIMIIIQKCFFMLFALKNYYHFPHPFKTSSKDEALITVTIVTETDVSNFEFLWQGK